MDNSTSRLADGVWRVEVGRATNAYVVANDGSSDVEGLTLVDTGWSNSGPRLIRSIRLAGLDPRALQTVLLTHWHADHTGSAARLARSSAEVSFFAGSEDLAVITGSERHPHAKAPLGDVTWLGRHFADLLSPSAEPLQDVPPIADGTTLETGGGMQVLATPGHTPGHLSFWLPTSGVLLAGDAVMNLFRPSRWPGLVRSARRSDAATLERLADLDPAIVAVGHGPPITSNPRRHLSRLAERAAAERGA